MECVATEKGDSATTSCGKLTTDDNANTNVLCTAETAASKIEETTDGDQEPSEEIVIPEQVEFTVIFNKARHEISFPYDAPVKDLKAHLERICGVPQTAQKLIIKGMARDDATLRASGVVRGGKVMLVGSKMDDILAVTAAPQQALQEEKAASKEPLCMQKAHRKVLDKGMPPDIMPGIKGVRESLPPTPLCGMLNKHGGKVRLTFKPDQDQLWLGTKERTEKLACTSIKNITSEPIKEHEEYHIMGLQLGPTEASRYWVYWVPAQYVESIKDTILGVWQFF